MQRANAHLLATVVCLVAFGAALGGCTKKDDGSSLAGDFSAQSGTTLTTTVGNGGVVVLSLQSRDGESIGLVEKLAIKSASGRLTPSSESFASIDVPISVEFTLGRGQSAAKCRAGGASASETKLGAAAAVYCDGGTAQNDKSFRGKCEANANTTYNAAEQRCECYGMPDTYFMPSDVNADNTFESFAEACVAAGSMSASAFQRACVEHELTRFESPSNRCACKGKDGVFFERTDISLGNTFEMFAEACAAGDGMSRTQFEEQCKASSYTTYDAANERCTCKDRSGVFFVRSDIDRNNTFAGFVEACQATAGNSQVGVTSGTSADEFKKKCSADGRTSFDDTSKQCSCKGDRNVFFVQSDIDEYNTFAMFAEACEVTNRRAGIQGGTGSGSATDSAEGEVSPALKDVRVRFEPSSMSIALVSPTSAQVMSSSVALNASGQAGSGGGALGGAQAQGPVQVTVRMTLQSDGQTACAQGNFALVAGEQTLTSTAGACP